MPIYLGFYRIERNMKKKFEVPETTLRHKLIFFATVYQLFYPPNRFEKSGLIELVERACIEHEVNGASEEKLYLSLQKQFHDVLKFKGFTGSAASGFEIVNDTLVVPVAFERSFNGGSPRHDDYGNATIVLRDDYLLLQVSDDDTGKYPPLFKAEIWARKTMHPDSRNKEKYYFDVDPGQSFFGLNFYHFANELEKQIVPTAWDVPVSNNDDDDPDSDDCSGESTWLESAVLGICNKARELAITNLDEQQEEALTKLLLKNFLPAEGGAELLKFRAS